MGQLERRLASGTGFGVFGDKRERKGTMEVIAGRRSSSIGGWISDQGWEGITQRSPYRPPFPPFLTFYRIVKRKCRIVRVFSLWYTFVFTSENPVFSMGVNGTVRAEVRFRNGLWGIWGVR